MPTGQSSYLTNLKSDGWRGILHCRARGALLHRYFLTDSGDLRSLKCADNWKMSRHFKWSLIKSRELYRTWDSRNIVYSHAINTLGFPKVPKSFHTGRVAKFQTNAVTELCYSHILNRNRGSLHLRSFRCIHIFVFWRQIFTNNAVWVCLPWRYWNGPWFSLKS